MVVALQQPASDGLVEIAPQRGGFVIGPSKRDVEEIFDIRLLVEEYAAAHLMQSGQAAEFLRQAGPLLAATQKAVAPDEYSDYESFI